MPSYTVVVQVTTHSKSATWFTDVPYEKRQASRGVQPIIFQPARKFINLLRGTSGQGTPKGILGVMSILSAVERTLIMILDSFGCPHEILPRSHDLVLECLGPIYLGDHKVFCLTVLWVNYTNSLSWKIPAISGQFPLQFPMIPGWTESTRETQISWRKGSPSYHGES